MIRNPIAIRQIYINKKCMLMRVNKEQHKAQHDKGEEIVIRRHNSNFSHIVNKSVKVN